MRELLGADRKSAEGIVDDPCGHRRPEGNEQVRMAGISRCRFFGNEPPYGDQSDAAVPVIQWLESTRQRVDLKLVLNRRMRSRMYGGVGGAPEQSGLLSRCHGYAAIFGRQTLGYARAKPIALYRVRCTGARPTGFAFLLIR